MSPPPDTRSSLQYSSALLKPEKATECRHATHELDVAGLFITTFAVITCSSCLLIFPLELHLELEAPPHDGGLPPGDSRGVQASNSWKGGRLHSWVLTSWSVTGLPVHQVFRGYCATVHIPSTLPSSSFDERGVYLPAREHQGVDVRQFGFLRHHSHQQDLLEELGGAEAVSASMFRS